MTIANCSSCGAPVEWVVNRKTGKRMPLDVRPVNGGNVYKTGATDGESGAPIVDFDRAADRHDMLFAFSGTPRYTSHFATCPNAATHRRR